MLTLEDLQKRNKKELLIICDIQNDFFDKDSQSYTCDINDFKLDWQYMITEYTAKDWPIIATQILLDDENLEETKTILNRKKPQFLVGMWGSEYAIDNHLFKIIINKDNQSIINNNFLEKWEKDTDGTSMSLSKLIEKYDIKKVNIFGINFLKSFKIIKDYLENLGLEVNIIDDLSIEYKK